MACRSRDGLAVVLLAISACHTWSHVGTPQEGIARARTGTVQVTKTDRTVVVIESPTIIQDTLFGTSVDKGHARVAIPMSEVLGVATQEVSLWRTAGAAYYAAVVALGLAVIVLSTAATH